ncbi:Gfo/Idh/MocA family protein [Inquilinus sp. CA228]|uniref:Gfo/Idh/MocA family protein n=1 Tax=Inquilinus sp. CA228 TaxID=3455609 RepID=UPI003F8D752E
MARQWTIGVLGCGNIFDAYARLSAIFAPVQLVACADVSRAAAEAAAGRYGLRPMDPEAMLADPGIDAVVNLTNPASHATTTAAILEAGKHAYTEKPLALTLADGDRLVELAERRGLMLGSAPDTFLGGGHQTARRLIDEGRLGTVKSGSAHFMNHGMERWHPNPHPYYQQGAGPVLDMGPYYVSALVNLLGPVRRVVALATRFFDQRLVTAEGPNRGTRVPVTTPTTSQALLEFRSGAQIHASLSYDTWGHGHRNPIELHGTEGSLMIPDPNYFAGGLELVRDGAPERFDPAGAPFGRDNWIEPAGRRIGNYRGLGLADMLDAAETGRPARASGRFARHVLEVLLAIVASAEAGRFVEIGSTTDRPAPMTPEDAARLTAAGAPQEFTA